MKFQRLRAKDRMREKGPKEVFKELGGDPLAFLRFPGVFCLLSMFSLGAPGVASD